MVLKLKVTARPVPGVDMSRSRLRLLMISLITLAACTVGFLTYLILHRISIRNTEPEITCETDVIRVSVNAPREELLAGVTAFDAEDGDLTDSVIIESISQFVEKGKCTITYAVFDSRNKAATASRTLYYTDYHSPRFELLTDFIYSIGTAVNPLAGIRAYDVFDGDITSRISMTTVGSDEFSGVEYPEVEFRVINSYGDVATLRVNIVTEERASTNVPVINQSNYLVYMNAGEKLDPLVNVESIYVSRQTYPIDDYGRDSLMADTSGFDPDKPGLYRIPIYCEAGDYVGSTVLYVIVEG